MALVVRWPKAILDTYLDAAPTRIACESDVIADLLARALRRRRVARALSLEVLVREDTITLRPVQVPAKII